MSTRATHWCYACRRPIRVRGRDIVCPNCNDGFIQEISETGGMMNTFGLIEPDFEEFRSRRFGMMEAMSSLMRQRMAEMSRDPVSDTHGRQGIGAERSESTNIDVIFRRGRRIGTDRPNFSGLLVRPSLEVLFEQLMLQNNRPQGPAPAPQSSIDSMPVVKINRRHLIDDPQCPVCKDKFEIGSEAREMPCKHLYHADCIIPWLVQHNSCPVCRHPLPSQADPETIPRNYGSGNQDIHSYFPFVWPFGQSSSSSSSYQYEGDVGEPAPVVFDDPSQLTYTEWNYDH
ncbi:hypothetical protein PR202_ga09338 [Eleusine coracana subsp. coracana]|uniref:RING-type E3 ubiquitin transferase n=1 Tax=Eleusine coracana subsp. coracana TaxID=191504 RepID=A0AAV5C2A9_ELECO|nr:hypothetical protein PR202_ga09338 [Eleusine coracana subsp. coracana]